jgi:site-specific DNA-methyltransferase (adenine-specific)
MEGRLISNKKNGSIKTLNTDTIYAGDSAKILKDKKLFPDNSIDLIVTSPPYADKRNKHYDSVHPNDYVDWFMPIANELYRVLKEDGSFILNIKEHPMLGERHTYVLELILEMKKSGWYWIEEYVWYKKNSFPGKWPNRFRDSWERCLHFSKNKKFKMYQDSVKVPIGDWSKKRFKSLSDKDFKRHMSQTNDTLGRNVSNWINRKKVFPHNVIVFEDEHYVSNVLEFATVCNNRVHSAVFPLELPTWFIKLFTRKNNIVLDPFIGSGTTAFACLGLGRKFIGIEQNKDFVVAALKHIDELKTN